MHINKDFWIRAAKAWIQNFSAEETERIKMVVAEVTAINNDEPQFEDPRAFVFGDDEDEDDW